MSTNVTVNWLKVGAPYKGFARKITY